MVALVRVIFFFFLILSFLFLFKKIATDAKAKFRWTASVKQNVQNGVGCVLAS